MKWKEGIRPSFTWSFSGKIRERSSFRAITARSMSGSWKPRSLSCMKNLKNKKTLILTRRDIDKLIDMKKAMAALQRAFLLYGRGHSQMPPKMYLNLERYHGDFRA